MSSGTTAGPLQACQNRRSVHPLGCVALRRKDTPVLENIRAAARRHPLLIRVVLGLSHHVVVEIATHIVMMLIAG